MAKKAARRVSKKKAARSKRDDGGIAVEVSVNVPEDIGPYYVNFIEVGHTKHEFSLSCGLVPTKPSPSQILAADATGQLKVEAAVQIIVPPTLISGLLNALTSQKEKYEKEHGISLDK